MQFTTLVPAYKPKYLVELLTCLRHQTHKPAKIIFSDDNPQAAFTAALNSEPLKSLIADLNIEVIQGPRNGGYNNFCHLFRHYSAASDRTELFHVLLDDDLIYPTFYAEHLRAHGMAPVACVVSRRWGALENGQPTRDNLPVPDAIANNSLHVMGLTADVLFQHTVGAGRNWLGEFSNATFRADMAPRLLDTTLAGISYAGLEDLAAFLKASLKTPVGYINSYLGAFRYSAEQNSAQTMGRPLKLAFLAYLGLAIAGRNLGRLTEKQCKTVINVVGATIELHYRNQEDLQALCALMPFLRDGDASSEADFLRQWQVYSGDAGSVRQPAISILIPVFNGAKYLQQTVASLQAQEFTDFEAWFVDDASTDESVQVLQRYAEFDSRFKILRLDENQGCAPKVLNRALNYMQGTHYVYASQDDQFSKDWLAKLYAKAVESGADAVIPDVILFHQDDPVRNASIIGFLGDRDAELSGTDAAIHSLEWHVAGNALWNAELIKKLRYDEFSFNADEFSARKFFLNCNKVVFCSGQFFYRQDNPFAVTKQVNAKRFEGVETHLRLAQLMHQHGVSAAVWQRELVKAQVLWQQLHAWFSAHANDLKEEDKTSALDAERRQAELLGQFTGLAAN